MYTIKHQRNLTLGVHLYAILDSGHPGLRTGIYVIYIYIYIYLFIFRDRDYAVYVYIGKNISGTPLVESR